uniref:Non-haem dioxygenase N-terminal domain-containing protein n=1 Tax=Cucumis sativus TaxID=3659 RepID=A0A0A0L322_CUCSA
MAEIEPPLEERYNELKKEELNGRRTIEADEEVIEECEEEIELPVIDLGQLKKGNLEREKCKKEIVEAAMNWGFFQVINHGVAEKVLNAMINEQKKVFNQPFVNKSLSTNFLNLPSTHYRWGNPVAISSSQISWSEAFHIPVLEVSTSHHHITLRYALYLTVPSSLSLRYQL